MHPQAAGRGKIAPRCVPKGASDGKNTGSWQYIAAMYSNTAIFGKICALCIRKAPQSAVGEHTARASCRQGAFSPSEALKSCTARKSCHPLTDLAPTQGRLPPPSASPMPHTLPLRKNEAAKLAKNFAKRVILTPQTRFRRPSGEICSKRAPRLLLSTRFEYVSRSSWQRPANSAYVWAKSRPMGAESPFEKQKCTRKSKSSPRARACGLISTIECRMPCHCGKNEPIMCPHIIGNGWLRACAGALWPQGNEGAKPSLYQ